MQETSGAGLRFLRGSHMQGSGRGYRPGRGQRERLRLLPAGQPAQAVPGGGDFGGGPGGTGEREQGQRPDERSERVHTDDIGRDGHSRQQGKG